jgi:regulator of replication initiation timing
MATKIIDDETALTIFEAIQENATRSFARYNCLRQLPRHKVNGEFLFYLEELLDFAERELKQEPSETLGQVVDMGLTSWFGSLAPQYQRKAGFSLRSSEAVQKGDASDTKDADDASDKTPTDTKEALKLLTQKNKRILELEQEVEKLRDAVEASAVEKLALKREIAHLEQVNEELAEQAPPHPVAQQQGYMTDPGLHSGYMALTTHTLTAPQTQSKDSGQASSSKKSRKRRRKKGGARSQENPPQNDLPQ